jgi:CRP-like cAMP-binding protein
MKNPASTRNRLLAGIILDKKDLGSSEVDLVQLELRQIICEIGALVEYVYFPETSVASVITTMADGDMVEVGMVGSEGVVGLPALLGTGISSQHIIVQVSGTALRVAARRCKILFEANEEFRSRVLRYCEEFMNLAGQTAACNRLHTIEQRCARWLLMACDRIAADEIPMTHEFLAAMLGSRRAGVTEVAGKLQRGGIIRYRHGQLKVRDRKGLENTACECYRADHVRLVALKAEGGR